MKNEDSDQIIRNLLLDIVAEEYFEELSAKDPVFTSIHFQQQMNKMLSNPNAWLKKHQHSLVKRVMKMVAIICLTISVMFGSLVMLNPRVRAAVIEWIIEFYETHIVYSSFGKHSSAGLPDYVIADLPDEYSVVGVPTELLDGVEVTYENLNGQRFYFQYMYITEGSALLINTEDMVVTEITINGNKGHLYTSCDSEQSNIITWYDSEEMIQFTIDGFLDNDTLLTLAKSVRIMNK